MPRPAAPLRPVLRVLPALFALGCPSDPRPRVDAGSAMDAPVSRDVTAAVGSTLGTSDGTEQQPPTTGRTAMRAWLAAGAWKRWHCETTPHATSGLSPHGLDRICTNDVLFNAGEDPPWPVGAASVKELHDPSYPEIIVGYAANVKVRDGAGGAGWYWFEEVFPAYSPGAAVLRDPDGTIADGFGESGNAGGVCVPCHGRSTQDGTSDGGMLGYGEFVVTRIGVTVR